MKMNLKGKKRFENYLKREEEKEAWYVCERVLDTDGCSAQVEEDQC